MKREFWFGFFAACLIWIFALTVPLLFVPQPLSRALFSLLDVSSPPARADYVLVPSGNLFYRLPHAIALLHHHLGDTLLLTVTEPARWRRDAQNFTEESVTESSLVIRLLRMNGIGDTQVIFLGESRSTWQDARLFSDFLADRPAANATVVSDGFHLRRIRLSFTRTNPAVAARVSYAASSSFDDLLRRDVEVSDTYQMIFKECIKFVFYFIGRA